MLVATLSQFLELKSDLELLRSECNADMIEDQADALWAWVCPASDSLVLHISPLITCSPPNDVGE
jgi:hypothetical protein